METAAASTTVNFSVARLRAIAAAVEAGHEKVTPRDPAADADELSRWVRSRYFGAIEMGQAELQSALRDYAAELGVEL